MNRLKKKYRLRIYALYALYALALTIVFLVLEHSISHRRWGVKTFSDRDRSLVNLQPQESTVATLSRLQRPAGTPPDHDRIPPYELRLYRVRARLLAIHRELDGDFHLVLGDPADLKSTIIVEIPAPSEGRAAGYEEAFRKCRDAVNRRAAPPPGGWLVEVTGVGFFDATHWQPGASPSGFELHPVLELRFLE